MKSKGGGQWTRYEKTDYGIQKIHAAKPSGFTIINRRFTRIAIPMCSVDVSTRISYFIPTLKPAGLMQNTYVKASRSSKGELQRGTVELWPLSFSTNTAAMRIGLW